MEYCDICHGPCIGGRGILQQRQGEKDEEVKALADGNDDDSGDRGVRSTIIG